MDPTEIGPYTIERTLGRGGMATVYLAKEIAGRRVALKLMHPALASDPLLVERFVREMQATRELKHPNLVELYAAGEIDGRLVMACELCDGGSVESLLAATGKLAAPLALELTAQLLEGLGYAHAKGIVHRDLKPANLLLTRAGRLKIGDFGIARTAGEKRLTRTGLMMGTPGYVSPEQAQGKVVDGRSDLFSAGVLLYELLSGRGPHEAPDATAMLARVMRGADPIAEVDPTVAPALEALLERLLALDPRERPASAEAALQLVLALGPRQPGLVAEALADPAGVHAKLCAAQAAQFALEARRLLGETPPRRAPAALWLHRATLLEPGNAGLAQALAGLCAQERLQFAPSQNPRVHELEEQLRGDAPGNAKVALQLAQLYRLEGNVLASANFLKRALRLRPGDAYVAAQLLQLTGERPALRGPVTANMAAGIRTGGFGAGAADASVRADAAQAGAVQPGAPRPEAAPLGLLPEVAPASQLQLLWRQHGTLLGVLGVLLLLGLGVGAVGRFMRSSNSGVEQAGAQLHRAIAQGQASAKPDPAAASAGALSAAPAPETAARPGAQTPAAPPAPETAARPAAQTPAAPPAPETTAASGASAAAAPAPQTSAGPGATAPGAAPAHRRIVVDASSTLEGQLAAHARDASERLAQATAALRAHDYARAAAESEDLIAAYPKRAEAEEAGFVRASALFGQGQPGPARAAFAQLRREHPGSPRYAEALLREGQAASQEGDLAAAQAALGELLGNFRESPFALEGQLLRGQVRARAGDAASARADYRQVLSRTGPADELHRSAAAALASLPARELH